MYNNVINFSIKINFFEAFAGYKQVIKLKFISEFYKGEAPAVTNHLNNLKKTKIKLKIELTQVKD